MTCHRYLPATVALLTCLLALHAGAQITNPIPTPIPKGDVRVHLQSIVTGLTAPNLLTFAPDGTDRSFILDQDGQIVLVKNGAAQPTAFLDVSGRLATLNANFSKISINDDATAAA